MYHKRHGKDGQEWTMDVFIKTELDEEFELMGC